MFVSPQWKRSDNSSSSATAVLEPPPVEASEPASGAYRPTPPKSLVEAGLNNEMVDALIFK